MGPAQWSAIFLVQAKSISTLRLFADGRLVKYLSNPTSTFIVRVNREHFRLVWAALTFMDRVPGHDGKPCIFRVVHVSGTIRKVEEEAIRRARALILAAKDEMVGKGSGALEALFGTPKDPMAAVTASGDEEMGDSAEEGEIDQG